MNDLKLDKSSPAEHSSLDLPVGTNSLARFTNRLHDWAIKRFGWLWVGSIAATTFGFIAFGQDSWLASLVYLLTFCSMMLVTIGYGAIRNLFTILYQLATPMPFGSRFFMIILGMFYLSLSIFGSAFFLATLVHMIAKFFRELPN
jgi:hypothetical protein